MRAQAEIAKGNKFRPLPPNFPAFIGITDPKLTSWVQERFTPHPISTHEDPPPLNGPQSASIPWAFIHYTQGPTAPVFKVFASRAYKLGWNVYKLEAGHAAMLTQPRELADILLRITNG